MISRALTATGAALLAASLGAAAYAASVLDVDWTVERSRPPEVRLNKDDPGAWGLANGGLLGLSAGGYRLSGREHDQCGRNAGDMVIYRFDEATAGAGVSEETCDFSVGDYIDDLPVPEADIDWVAMTANTEARAVREQYVRFIDSDAPTNRILVTRSGVFSLDWVLKDGTFVPRTYEVGLKVSEVPRRIFWTSKPFDAPVVQLPSGMGFRAAGDPKLFGGSFTNDYGVYVDLDNRVVGANARVNADGTFDGPRGQFVLFYYDSPDCQHCLGFEVVEVGPPDPTYQSARIGEEVHPSCWEALNADDVLAVLETTEDTVMGTVGRAPYLLQQQANGAVRHKKAGKVFAISETEPGDLGAQKAAVYWEAKGPSGVYWPFERTCYHITWPDDCPVMIVGDGDPADGCEVGLPDLYQASLLDWRVPEGVVQGVSPSNTVRVLKPGHFTLRFDTKAMDDFFLMPIAAVRHDDPRYAPPVVTVDVGEEVVPAFGVRAGRNADLAEGISLDHPGYIYEKSSPGRNWNPHLYHGSVASGELTELPAEEDTDPYAALGSAIYLVSPTPSNRCVEVWWKKECRVGGMEAGAVIPALPQRYHAVWPKESRLPEICIASQRGSDAPSAFCDKSEPAIYFRGDPASEPVAFIQPVDIADEGFTVTFGVNLAPEEADGHAVRPNATPCEFLSLAFLHGEESGSAQTNGDLRLSFRACAPEGDEARFEILSTLTRGRQIVRKTIVCAAATNDWTDFSVSVTATNNAPPVVFLGTNRLETVVDSASGCDFDYRNLLVTLGGNGYQRPSGLAVSGVCVYGFPFESDDFWDRLTTVNYDLSAFLLSDIAFGEFGDDEGLFVVDWERGDADYIEGDVAIDGEPIFRPSSLYAENGVEPRVYWNNRSGTVGYCPNLQHAFTTPEGDHTVVWALRNDLCTGDERPYVLAEYPLMGRGAMQVYRVTFTNEFYRMPEIEMEAGNKVPTFRPLDRLRLGLSKETIAESVSTNEDGVVTHRDRTGQLWARRDGAFRVFYSYPLEQGFFVPGEGDNQPPEGTMVNFMSVFASETNGNGVPPTLVEMNKSAFPIGALSKWPSSEGLPVLKTGQVLTKAKNGLPEVWGARSIGVIYPSAYDTTEKDVDPAKQPVKVIDPTVKRTYPIPLRGDFAAEYGFTLGDTGSCVRRRGLYYFQGLPPSIADRFYVDVNSNTSNKTGCVDMVLEGRLVENAAGTDYLLVNTLTTAERTAIENLCEDENWKTAARNLAKGDVEPSSVVGYDKTTVKSTYQDADHYALVATGKGLANGFDYVTLIENDSPDADDLPVSMHVIGVTNELYTAPLVVLEDENNALSEQLTIYYAAGLGESADNYLFEWIRRDPPTDGSYPHDLPDEFPPKGWEKGKSGAGLVSITVPEGANTGNVKATDLVNTYWTVRYRPTNEPNRYSHWCDPTLAEGWLQRVLNRITPFSQRLTDFYVNEAEIDFNMPAQIGAPYQGDVALNNDNLESVGLMQLYQTVFNRFESMSISVTDGDVQFNAAVGKQLIETVARLADLNLILAAEAYSDAKNPLISSSTSATPLPASGALFCFANQVPTLLDEELALLRGRSAAVAPLVRNYPYYNRLFWNLTKGITQGEVAYVNNYNIAAEEGVLDAAAAAASYPQGHGDAYGYYLSAVKLYYRLLRNPNFQWGEASMMEMLINQNVVNMDYQEEDKFAEAAKDLAKTATDILDLTARKQWRDTCGNAMESGYFDDSDVTNGPFPQAFGYGEWAVRGALGAFYNWATANSILPGDSTGAVTNFTDQSIKTVDRGTSTSLKPLGAAVATLERKLNALDAGVNPLGLSPDTVPFDINPNLLLGSSLSEGQSHYDQIRARAVKALENCATVLAYANAHGSRVRAIEDEDTDESNAAEETEASYNKQLVAIYGRPYSGDIGPGKTYEQGYIGPDIYHYNWMDLSQFGLQDIDTTHFEFNETMSRVKVKSVSDGNGIATGTYLPSSFEELTNSNNLDKVTIKVTLDISGEGIVKKPDDITGTRAAEGTLQAAYREFLTAYVEWKGNKSAFDRARTTLEWKLGSVASAYEKALRNYRWEVSSIAFTDVQNTMTEIASILEKHAGTGASGYAIELNGNLGSTRAMKIAIGRYAGGALLNENAALAEFQAINSENDSVSSKLKALLGAARVGLLTIKSTAENKVHEIFATAQNALQIAFAQISAVKAGTEAHQALISERESAYEKALEAYNDFVSAAAAVKTAAETLQAKYEAYRTILNEGETLQEELMTWRRRKASAAVSQRYSDMYERIARNTALATYSTAFDVAQRYVFELAKVYDYETGLLSADRAAGDDFLAKAVATRALGDPTLTIDSSQSDGGLWDVVNRMDANWEVLRGRLGVNNPDNQTKRFSLRYSKFRIDPGEKGDAAWRKELSKPDYWREDVFADAAVSLHCQPQQGPSGQPARKEPGFVIPFRTCVNAGENFFGQPLLGGETTFASADYSTKIRAIGVEFVGYDGLVRAYALADEPNIYLVPVGIDSMRFPAGTERRQVDFKVVDQVLPLPYTVGSTELDDPNWIATFSGLDGALESAVTVRRHSTLRAGKETTSSRLVGRSVWNDSWILVIPASSLHSDARTARQAFLNGVDADNDGRIDVPGVSDIRLIIQAYSRQGN